MADLRRLPEPDQSPYADVVIYDGRCPFCVAHVERLARLDRSGRLAFLSLHDPRVHRVCPDVSTDELMRQMYVVTRGGTRFSGAAAVRYLSRRLPRLWWLAPLMHLPGSLCWWERVYAWIARRRYRLGSANSCDNGHCDAD